MINVRVNNPYTTGYVLLNYQRLYRIPLVYEPSIEDKFHILGDDESLDQLAYNYYKDSKYWWVIYDINVEVIPNPFILPMGTSIIIPNLQKLLATQL